MDPPKIRNYKKGPERDIQDAILSYMRHRGWYVIETHGNMYQSGFPDLYCTHSQHGIRWIECKNPLAYSFTPAQIDTFPKLSANGTSIHILVAATDHEYRKLWHPANWSVYLMMKQRPAMVQETIRVCHENGVR